MDTGFFPSGNERCRRRVLCLSVTSSVKRVNCCPLLVVWKGDCGEALGPTKPLACLAADRL